MAKIKTEKAAKTDKSAKTNKSVKTEKSAKTEKAVKSAKSEKSAKTEKSENKTAATAKTSKKTAATAKATASTKKPSEAKTTASKSSSKSSTKTAKAETSAKKSSSASKSLNRQTAKSPVKSPVKSPKEAAPVKSTKAELEKQEKLEAERKTAEDKAEINRCHKQEYGTNADVVVTAPCRFHLMGDHSWFFKDKTLSMAVNLPVYVAASRNTDGFVHVQYVQLGEKKKISYSSIKFKKEDKWANAIKSILYGFGSAGFPLVQHGMNLTIYSKVLPSAGFGVTTAIKVATAWAIKELLSIRCSEATLVQIVERGNRYFLMTENHREDTYPAVYSKNGTMLLTDHAKNEWETVQFPFKDKTILLTDARVPRIITWNEESLLQPENVLLLGELKERSSNVHGGWKYEENGVEVNEVLSMVSEDAKRRLMSVMSEHKRILDALSAIDKKEFASFARAVNHSHDSMKEQYDISCPEIDWILKRLQEVEVSNDNVRNPISCGRITGKGFGRCLYTILPTEDVPKYMEKLNEYERIFGFKPEVYVVKPCSGVHII